MRMDDLISSLKFLNRRQLLNFCRANRLTFSIVENHFAEWPAIYCELSIVHKSKSIERPLVTRFDDDRPSIDSFLELKALNCDCEQQLSININELWTYKMAVKCECEEKSLFTEDGEHFELAAHVNCKEDWRKIENPILIPQFRSKTYYMDKLIEKYSFHYGSHGKCCQFFSHKVHDQQSRNSIVKDYILQHRRQNFAPDEYFKNNDMDSDAESEIIGNDEDPLRVCPTALLLRTRNVNKIIAHLEMNFVKIYKLYLQQVPTFCYCYYGDENEDGECQQNNDWNEAMPPIKCIKILQWIIENGKIKTKGISCVIDVNLIDELLGILGRNGNEQMNQQILLNSIGKCGHLQLISCEHFISSESNDIDWKNLSVLSNSNLQEMLLKNSLMITIGHGILIQPLLTIKNLLQIYNPQGNHRRLIVICQNQYISSIVDYLIESFLNSNNPSTYFLLIDAHFERKKFKQKYYNETTKEYLRVQAAYRYTVSDSMDVVSVYLARYSKMSSTIVEEEFELFFDRVNRNVEKRMRMCEAEIERKNYEKNNYGTWQLVPADIKFLDLGEDEEPICSFSAFLAKVFPGFSLNINETTINAALGNDAEELYNGGYVPFRMALLPPKI